MKNRELILLIVGFFVLLFLLSLAGAIASAAPAESEPELPSCKNGFNVTVSNVEDPSVHPDTKVIVRTDCSVLELHDVEAYPGKVTTGYVSGSTITDIIVVAGPDGKHSIDIDVDVVVIEVTPTPTIPPTGTPVPSETPTIPPTGTATNTPPPATGTATVTPPVTGTATASPTPGSTSTPAPTWTPPPLPRENACLRINFDLSGDVAEEGMFVVREWTGRVLAFWFAQKGWTDSDWIRDIDITHDSVWVTVDFYQVSREVYDSRPDTHWSEWLESLGVDPIRMRIVTPAPGTEYGWLGRGMCHALEVGWP